MEIALTLNQHSAAIKGAMSRTLEGFIEIGQKLMDARDELPKGEFQTLFDHGSVNYVGMSRSRAYEFVAISENQQKLIDNRDKLPSDVTQLQRIATMDVKDIKKAIKAEVIHPEMKRGEIQKWEKSLEKGDAPKPDNKAVKSEDVTIDVKSVEIPKNDVIDNLIDATAFVLENTPVNDRVKVLQGFAKKWKIDYLLLDPQKILSDDVPKATPTQKEAVEKIVKEVKAKSAKARERISEPNFDTIKA